MTVKFIQPSQALTTRNGSILWLPPNVIAGLISTEEPDPYVQSSVQQYPIGSKLEFGDGRLFRYGKWGATSTAPPVARLLCNANAAPGCTGEEDTDGYEGDPYTAAAIGDTYVDLEVATAYAENFFEDGMLACYPTGHYCEYRICGSELGNGTYCRVYIDRPSGLVTALGTTTGVTAYKSIFSQLKAMNAEGVSYTTPMGMYLGATFTANYFGWIQRRGRCIITPTAYFGDSVNERAVYYNPADGTIGTAATYDPSSGYICLGYLTQRTVSGYGDLEVFLKLE